MTSEEREVAPIGKAVLNLETSLTSEGTICDSCALHCPSDVRAIKMVNRVPQLDRDRCTGCGLCAYYCESRPGSIAIERAATSDSQGTDSRARPSSPGLEPQ